MITQYSITASAWTAITAAGESGTCWLDEEDDGAAGTVDVRISHSDSGVPSSGDVTKAKKVYKPMGNNDLMKISADNGSDIYYARCVSTGDTATITVDVV